MSARWRLAWAALCQRRRFDAELDAELEFHLEMRREALIAQGVPASEAARQARIELGSAGLHRDDCRRARGIERVDAVFADLRYALRGLRRNPGYTATALAVLGSAIAANTLLFALFNAYALRSPPIERLSQWVSVDAQNLQSRVLDKWTVADADALLSAPPAMFEGLYGFRSLRLPAVADVTRPVAAEAVSDNYFDLLGVRPSLGRTFGAVDVDAGATPAVVLSDLGWRRLARGETEAVGRSIMLAGRAFTVIGVMPPEFTGLSVNSTLLWIREADYRAMALPERGFPLHIDVGGILRADANPEQAAAALSPRVLAGNDAREDMLKLSRVRVEPRRGYLRADERAEIYALGAPAAAAFVLLLLVAAANLANLMLARFAARQRELAVRVAVGAQRGRLVRQLLAECLVLAMIAATLGAGFAALALGPLNAALFGLMGELGYDLIDVGVDMGVFAYGLALAVLAALSFGILPALMATAPWRRRARAERETATRQGGAVPRMRTGLMIVQLGASVVLLVLASLAAGNAARAEWLAIGYDPARLVAVDVSAPTPALAAALAEVPAVDVVAATSNLPLMRPGTPLDMRVGERSMPLASRVVDAAYFEALGLAPLQGRLLRRADEAGAAVVVISRATAQRLWPDQSPLGRLLDIAPQQDFPAIAATRHEVVGVVDDVVSGWFVSGKDASAVYFPGRLSADAAGTLMLRVRDLAPATLDALRTACARAVPEQNCELLPLSAAYRLQRLPFVIASAVSAALGWTALAISCVGLYGLVSYLVQQRRREIGVRLALGAPAARVARQMLGSAARQIAWGIGLGLPVAFALSRFAASVSDKLLSFDIASFVGVPLGLGALALLAAWLPARRIAGFPPTDALRDG